MATSLDPKMSGALINPCIALIRNPASMFSSWR
jgi:hypothetical protein